MPNTFGKGMDAIESPPDQLIQDARERGKITAYIVAARDPATSLEYIVKILNEKQPQPHINRFLARWPSEQVVR